MNINEYIKSVETLKMWGLKSSRLSYMYNNNSFFFKANRYFAKHMNIIIPAIIIISMLFNERFLTLWLTKIYPRLEK